MEMYSVECLLVLNLKSYISNQQKTTLTDMHFRGMFCDVAHGKPERKF